MLFDLELSGASPLQHLRVAHAYAGLRMPELSNVEIPAAPNDGLAFKYYVLAAQQGRMLGCTFIPSGTLELSDEDLPSPSRTPCESR